MLSRWVLPGAFTLPSIWQGVDCAMLIPIRAASAVALRNHSNQASSSVSYATTLKGVTKTSAHREATYRNSATPNASPFPAPPPPAPALPCPAVGFRGPCPALPYRWYLPCLALLEARQGQGGARVGKGN
jgi:hypothetical protein